MARKISVDQLFAKISDPSIPEEELRKYFEEDQRASDAFEPHLKLDPKRVEVPKTPEGRARSAALLNSVNWAARMRRRVAFNKKIGSGNYKGPVVVSEGDSWFQYPILLTDVIDNLSKHFAILSLGAAGDTMENMIKHAEYLKAIEETGATFLLLSGGGNDLVADGNLAKHLLPFDSGLTPVGHLLPSFDQLVSGVVQKYDRIFRQVTAAHPKIRILCHGYDYAIPNKGQWLGKPMIAQGISDAAVQKAITAEMMDRFNAALSALAAGFPSVTYVDNRRVVGDDRWHDELHPNDAGYAEVADGYKVIIDALAGERPRTRGTAPAVKTTPPRKGVSLHVGLNFVDPAHYGGWDGELAACEFDAEDMAAVADQMGYNATSLIRENATRDKVIEGIDKAAKDLKAGDIFFISYAGHGGQVPDFNRDEDDGKDETWCLFDGQLIDDELYLKWSTFKPGVRILVVSDSCHSGTVVRTMVQEGLLSPDPEEQKVTGRPRVMPDQVAARTYRNNRSFYNEISRSLGPVDENLLTRELNNPVGCTVRLLSGCQDNQVSMDGIGNGAFTSALLAAWQNGRFQGNYSTFHKSIVERMSPTQTPNHWVVGRPDPVFDGQSPFVI